MSITNQEIMRVVNRYIGVEGGYLGDFTYRTHAEFYPEYCDLDINPYQFEGTTRERFIAIVRSLTPDRQAKILRGVLQRFPVDASQKPETRTQGLHDEIMTIVHRLEGAPPVGAPTLATTSATVERALTDAEALIQTNGATSGVDRIHTALHGYLRAICESEGISHDAADSMTRLFRLLRNHHSRLQNLGVRAAEIERILQSFANIMDALNPIRNNASVAHPNAQLLESDEAILVINTARTLLHYLNAKMG